ncbi:hypothetical protein Taro_045241, partial [Colocasia esculenta]|nr:hypothetical protein [Colocasia esculenta]
EGSDEGTSKPERDLESWLPVTGSRKGKWWYATFHNVTAMVGAGVLGLPFAMSQLGWFPGIFLLVFSWLITLYTLWQLVQLHEEVPGKRFDRYHQLGQHALGNTLGYWIVAPQQAMVQASSDIVYMVTGGKSLHKSLELAMPHGMSLTKSHCILIFAAIQLVLSQLPNFNSLSCISFLAAFMSFWCVPKLYPGGRHHYSFISFAASIIKGGHNHPSYGPRSPSESDQAFGVLNALGTIAFAYAGHSVVLEIQATIPSTPEKPSTKPMWHGVVGAYIIVILCYLSVAIAGYWAFGNLVQDDVLISLDKPDWLIAIANSMVFFHVVGSYQVFAMPIFDLIESSLVRRLNLAPGRILRIWSRSAYVCT